MSGRKARLSLIGRAYDPDLDDESQFWTREEMAEMRLAEDTRNSYLSAVKTHTAAGFDPTYEGFLKHCSWKKHALSLGKARLVRVALMWWGERCGTPWTLDQKSESLNPIKTIPNRSDEAAFEDLKMPVGAITEAMFVKMFYAINSIKILCFHN